MVVGSTSCTKWDLPVVLSRVSAWSESPCPRPHPNPCSPTLAGLQCAASRCAPVPSARRSLAHA
eukprot:1862502-Rhodomonas_salina.1